MLRNDGYVTPRPPVARGADEVVEAVQKAGHKVCSLKSFNALESEYVILQVIDCQPPPHAEALKLYVCQTPLSLNGFTLT